MEEAREQKLSIGSFRRGVEYGLHPDTCMRHCKMWCADRPFLLQRRSPNATFLEPSKLKSRQRLALFKSHPGFIIKLALVSDLMLCFIFVAAHFYHSSIVLDNMELLSRESPSRHQKPYLEGRALLWGTLATMTLSSIMHRS